MAQWLNLSGSNIVGWQSGAVAPEGAVFATDAEIGAYRAARDAMSSDGRIDAPKWINGVVTIPADTRPIFSVTCDRAVEPMLGHPVMDADGVDFVTVTVKKMVDEQTVDVAFNSTLYLVTASGRTWKMAFINGVATKQFFSHSSGRFDVSSQGSYRVITPFVVIAVE